MAENGALIAAVDVGAECVKAVIVREGVGVVGRAVVPTRGYFNHRVQEAMDQALDEAQAGFDDLSEYAATGFAANAAASATIILGETSCHAAGAFYHYPHAMSVIDIGGRESKVIHVDERGQPEESRAIRKCAVGIGTFLMFAARHLDVHPTQLQELAAAASEAAAIGSYCSVFASSEILERLREGTGREEIALGCLQSVAERIHEVGGFLGPVRVTGGVAEYFPGVLKSLSELSGHDIEAVPEPIMAGALGAALKILHPLAIPAGA